YAFVSRSAAAPCPLLRGEIYPLPRIAGEPIRRARDAQGLFDSRAPDRRRIHEPALRLRRGAFRRSGRVPEKITGDLPPSPIRGRGLPPGSRADSGERPGARPFPRADRTAWLPFRRRASESVAHPFEVFGLRRPCRDVTALDRRPRRARPPTTAGIDRFR